MNTRSISSLSLFLCIFISSSSAQVQPGLHVEENMTVLFGRDTTGAGIKAFWLPSKAAFRLGIVGDMEFQGENLQSDSEAWDYDSIGILSFASGLASKAKGDYSAAMGELVEANGTWSFAMGTATRASGNGSAAIGSNCESQGFASMAFGDHMIARGRGAMAVGAWNEPIDDINSTADSIRIFVVGNGTFSQRSNAMVVRKSGQIGIGTSSPFHLLDLGTTNGRKLAIHQSTNGDDYYGFGISANTLEFHVGNNEADDPQMVVKKSSGNVGIGTTGPTAQLHTTSTVRFANFGAGTLTTDANGNLSVSSDLRLKDVTGRFIRGLEAITRIEPVLYQWNESSGLDTTSLYAGFSAQNVREVIPEAVDVNADGYLTLSDRPIIASLVNAVSEQQAIIEKQSRDILELRRLVQMLINLDSDQWSTAKD